MSSPFSLSRVCYHIPLHVHAHVHAHAHAHAHTHTHAHGLYRYYVTEMRLRCAFRCQRRGYGTGTGLVGYLLRVRLVIFVNITIIFISIAYCEPVKKVANNFVVMNRQWTLAVTPSPHHHPSPLPCELSGHLNVTTTIMNQVVSTSHATLTALAGFAPTPRSYGMHCNYELGPTLHPQTVKPGSLHTLVCRAGCASVV